MNPDSRRIHPSLSRRTAIPPEMGWARRTVRVLKKALSSRDIRELEATGGECGGELPCRNGKRRDPDETAASAR